MIINSITNIFVKLPNSVITNRFAIIPATFDRSRSIFEFFPFEKRHFVRCSYLHVKAYFSKIAFKNMIPWITCISKFLFIFPKCVNSQVLRTTTNCFNNRLHDFRMSINFFSIDIDGSVSPLSIKRVLRHHHLPPFVSVSLPAL